MTLRIGHIVFDNPYHTKGKVETAQVNLMTSGVEVSWTVTDPRRITGTQAGALYTKRRALLHNP